jgi:prepilin-type N-terminal cleavage/methylation domain-containing protein
MVWTVVTGVVALLVAGVGSRAVGRLLKSRPAAWYFAANAVVFLAAVGLFALSSAPHAAGSVTSDAIYGLALGLGFGGLAGLRYGYKGLFELAAARSDESGFTLVEMLTSVAVMLVVLTAAWLMLSASSANLNMIGNGGQTSEANRAAMSAFERDLSHGVLPSADVSPVLEDTTMTCSILVSDTGSGARQLVTWRAVAANDTLVRVITQPNATAHDPAISLADFVDGASSTTTMVTGLDWRNTHDPDLFSYTHDATTWNGSVDSIGLVTMHLRNGMPESTSNVTDRTGVFRVTAYIINGY